MTQKIPVILSALICGMAAQAYDYVKDGIYYTVISESEATVSVDCGNKEKIDYILPESAGPAKDIAMYDYYNWVGNSYKGDIVIPERVELGTEGKSYTVTEIAMGAFCKCSDLLSVKLPETLKHVGIGAFALCTSIEEIVIPDGVTTIAENAFQACSAIKKLHFSLGCDCILEGTFQNCGAPEGMTVDGLDNVSGIMYYAFFRANMSNYPSWDSLDRIYGSAFDEATIEEVQLQPGIMVTPAAFGSCEKLRTVIIHQGVKVDQDFPLNEIFENCNAISLIRLYEPVPPALNTDWAATVTPGCVLEVPIESVDAYKSAEYWNQFVVRGFDTSAVSTLEYTTPTIKTHKGGLEVSGCRTMQVTDLNGCIIYNGVSGKISLSAGTYIITAGNRSSKIIITE